MGLFGDILGGIGKIATSIIPGPVDDLVFEGAKRVFGGGSSQPRQQGRLFKGPMVNTQSIIPQPVGVGRIQTRTGQQSPRLPDINIGGGVRINPPFGGSPGAGVTTQFQAGPSRSGTNLATRARAGMPMIGPIAVEPEVMQVSRRDCPPSYVLAIDGLCYPRQMVPARFREWKPAPRPVVSRADQKAIQRAARAKKRLVNLTKKAGAHASLTKPRRK